MHFGTDMVGNQADDTLAIGDRHHQPRVGEPGGEPVHPDTAIRVQHHLDYGGLFQQAGNGGTECRAHHACAPLDSFLPVVDGRHCGLVFDGASTGRSPIGDD